MASPTISSGPDVPDLPKRARIQLSCSSCRRAKLRCDRSQPCSQCTKRNKQDLCEYAKAPMRQKPPKSMQSRLHHLESLVINMMNDQISMNESSASSSVPRSNLGVSVAQGIHFTNLEGPSQYPNQRDPGVEMRTDALPIATAPGQVILGTRETSYIGATHWAAILEDFVHDLFAQIEQLRDYFHKEQDESVAAEHDLHTTAMALGNTTVDDRAGIFAALPNRTVIDRLVGRYFNSNDPAMIIIHKPTFQKEYQEFWKEPSTAPITWLGLLFSMLCLATLSLLYAGDDPLEIWGAPVDIAKKYQVLCSKCLVLGNYTKPGRYTVQTLLLYFESEFMRTGDIAKCWLLHGLLVRVALRMGYHRDARNHSNITAFDGEMRRRMWHMVAQVDLLLSFQLGLPSMIRVLQSDTTPPHNLFDNDFCETSPELPPERPDFEPTPVSYMICKSRICQVFGMITEQANLITRPIYAEVMELDARLHDVYALVPPFLVGRPLDQSITDTPNLIMQRFNIILLFHKSRCVLHRKYLAADDPKSIYIYSKSSCIDSALELLHCQSAIHDAVQPGGPLSRDRWFLSTIAAHDFLLGAMVLYVALTRIHEAMPAVDGQGNGIDNEIQRRQRMFQQLETSHELWTRSPKEARDSKKASEVLKMILETTRRQIIPGNAEATVISGRRTYINDALQQSDNYSEKVSAFEPNRPTNQTLPGLWEDLGSMIGMPDNLNWETWDSQINAPVSERLNPFLASDMAFEDLPLFEDTDMTEQSSI